MRTTIAVLLVTASCSIPAVAGNAKVQIIDSSLDSSFFSPGVEDGSQDDVTLSVGVLVRESDGIRALPDRNPNADTKRFVVRWTWVISSQTGVAASLFQEVPLSRPSSGGEMLVQLQNSWNGRVPVGTSVPEGEYRYRVSASVVRIDLLGNGRTKEKVVGESQPVTGLLHVDNTPPVLSISWPPADVFGTDLNTVELEGRATDALSGVGSVAVEDDQRSTTENLTFPSFMTLLPLETSIPSGETARGNFFTVSATDRAGNRTGRALTVDYTFQSTIVPVDPATLTPANGMLVSNNEVFVVFDTSVPREDIHSIVRREGGRVAGYLDAIHAALVVFLDVDSMSRLQQVIAGLQSRSGVLGTQLTGLIPASQGGVVFDNDLLGAGVAGAYFNINSTPAAQWINDHVPPAQLRPVHIAVIDSGLNPAFGMNEFPNINFMDACNPNAPQPPQDLSGHGTSVTGIIAGANNGQGNNGITQGVNAGFFDVTVFRTKCVAMCAPPAAPGCFDGNAILFAMNNIVATANFEVVNMSFGTQGAGVVGQNLAYRQVFQQSPGVLWVAAAGNGGADCLGDNTGCTDHSPSGFSCAFNNVIGVAAHDWRTWNGTTQCPAGNVINVTGTMDRRAYFSNFGMGTQISGASPFVHTATGVNAYGDFSGTSASSPEVVAAAALVLSTTQLAPVAVRTLLVNTARPLTDDPFRGLDALAAVSNAGQASGGPLAYASACREQCTCPPGSPLCYICLARGHDTLYPPPLWTARPALSRFFFDFGLRGFQVDNHLEEIRVDLRVDQVHSAYQDADPTGGNDFYSWCVTGKDLPLGTVYRIAAGGSAGGSATVAIPDDPGVPVLTGFVFKFDNGDHHIDRIRIHFTPGPGGSVNVEYNDQNDDDPFIFFVLYAVVPQSEILATGSMSGGPARGMDTAQLSGSNYVLQGFTLDYEPVFTNGEDHHIDQIGIELEDVANGHANVWYNDANDDDGFTWSIDWVQLVR